MAVQVRSAVSSISAISSGCHSRGSNWCAASTATTCPWRTTGTVTRVYAWEGPVYGPVFDYRDASGQTRSASNGMSSANWNFAIGSQHDIYVLPGSNGDVRLANFERLWLLPTVIAGIGLALMIPALIVALMIRRWLRGGAAR